MAADQEIIPQKSWSHAVERVKKTGYADGASEGREVAFQSSFDVGFQQGIDFGFKIGFQQVCSSLELCDTDNSSEEFIDHRKINCQICINGITNIQNIGNFYNMQQEKNNEFFK